MKEKTDDSALEMVEIIKRYAKAKKLADREISIELFNRFVGLIEITDMLHAAISELLKENEELAEKVANLVQERNKWKNDARYLRKKLERAIKLPMPGGKP